MNASLPHARGGVSTAVRSAWHQAPSSPRPWGCFFIGLPFEVTMPVFPTPVGVFLKFRAACPHDSGLPHARGGVSLFDGMQRDVKRSSPRPWGCFLQHIGQQEVLTVFPTPVGVFRYRRTASAIMRRLPHARGGVSTRPASGTAQRQSSPRPWGCFYSSRACAKASLVFPTPVGVFLILGSSSSIRRSLPHARGGVSNSGRIPFRCLESSPRPWGCFYSAPLDCGHLDVFPTPVGVFLLYEKKGQVLACLPHARGGVSYAKAHHWLLKASSPRPWGCFPLYAVCGQRPQVFPTPVGVFPVRLHLRQAGRRLPHARGGVSREPSQYAGAL